MPPPGADVVLVRYNGDIVTKSTSVQRSMESQLAANIEAILTDRGIDATVETQWTRIFIHTDEDDVADAATAAAEAFGVVSASPVLAVEPTPDAVADALARTARHHANRNDWRTFAVDARRSWKEHPFTSHNLEKRGGATILDAIDGAEVDLENPDQTFGVECRKTTAYVYHDHSAGPGGFPVGSQRPIVALVSGGIDSPVAAYEILRRGCPIIPVYMDLGEYGGPDHRARALAAVGHLLEYVPNHLPPVYTVHAGEALDSIVAGLDTGRMLAVRRFMFRVAEHIADRENASGIATGESLGQKSSQTGVNLVVTSAATDMPIHRPLLACDKNEITDRARSIGTFESARIPAGCNRLAPDRPATEATLDEQLDREPAELFEWAAEAAANAETIDGAQVKGSLTVSA